MSCSRELPIQVYRGLPLSEAYWLESDTRIYKPIQGATKAAPCVINSTTHNLPAGWPFAITGALGMSQINRGHLKDGVELYKAVVLTADTLELNDLNSLALNDYTGSGIIEYFKPEDLSVYVEAEAQFRRSLEDTTPFETLKKTTGEIVLDNVAKQITLQLDAARTAALAVGDGVYNLIGTRASGAKDILIPNSPLSILLSATR